MSRPFAGMATLVVGLTCSAAWPAHAQSGAPSAQSDADEKIVVTAQRVIVEALRGIDPERTYDDEAVASFGISTVGELVDEVRAENGDDEPVFLVNGEPVTDIEDVADFPAEAVARLEVLPRGSGQRIGGAADRRVYNVVLRDQVRSLTMTAAGEVATDGGWGETSGEAILSRIAGRDRLNLTLRARGSSALSEAERGIIQPDFPFASLGIDYYEPADLASFRTLRGETRSYDASLLGSNRLAPWLTATYSLRGRILLGDSLSGLPAALFALPGTSPFSPSGNDLVLLLYGAEPLRQRTENRNAGGNLALAATRGGWLATLTGQYDFVRREFRSDRQDYGVLASPVTVPSSRNPFTDPLAEFFIVGTDFSRARESSHSLRLHVGGPVLALPAGPMRARLAVERQGRSLRAARSGSQAGSRIYERTETWFEAGLDIPLASRAAGFLPALGELNVSLDHARGAIAGLSDLQRSSAALLWQPFQSLSASATISRTEELPAAESLADPVVVSDNVRTFDFLTAETVDVRFVTGGNPGLRTPTTTIRRLSVTAAPWRRYNMQISADYESITARDFVGAVPPASADVFRAFPDRFMRDAAGRLVSVDSRPSNFDRQSRREFRYGVSVLVPLGGARGPAVGAAPAAAGPRPRLQVVASHAIVLRDEVIIRPGLPVVDLLHGGALGFGGGRSRHLANASITFSERGSGVRLTGQFRSATTLRSGTTAVPDMLRFAPMFTASLRVYAEMGSLLEGIPWLEDSRLSVTVNNVANRRQRVTDSSGLTPLRFQLGYREPVGRTVEVEFRKVF